MLLFDISDHAVHEFLSGKLHRRVTRFGRGPDSCANWFSSHWGATSWRPNNLPASVLTDALDEGLEITPTVSARKNQQERRRICACTSLRSRDQVIEFVVCAGKVLDERNVRHIVRLRRRCRRRTRCSRRPQFVANLNAGGSSSKTVISARRAHLDESQTQT